VSNRSEVNSPADEGPVQRMVSRLAQREAREPKPAMILRLLAEAQAGVKCEVSMVDALDFRRDQYGLTWSEFGMLLGLSPQHMSEVKNGHRRLPIGAVKRAYAIGVPADALMQHLTANVEFSGVPAGHSSNHPAGGTSAGTQG